MKKIVVLIVLALVLIWLIQFLHLYKNYQFTSDVIWKIEQQRREHINMFPSIGRVIHNKGSFLSYTVLETYFSYYSPSTFFCCNIPLALGLLISIMFYGGFYLLLKRNLGPVKVVLSWIMIYPAFMAFSLRPPSILTIFPMIIPSIGVLLNSLYIKIKSPLK
jgi:hypothetical protein